MEAFLAKDSRGYSLLEYTVVGGSVQILRALTIPVEAIQERIRTYISGDIPSLVGLAGESGSKAMLEYIIALLPEGRAAQALIQADASGHTPIMRAVMSENAESIALLVKKLQAVLDTAALTAHINQANGDGQTALTLAASSNAREVGEMLLRAGANLNYTIPSSGLNVLQVAEFGNYIEFMIRSIRVLDEISGSEKKGISTLKSVSFWRAEFNRGALKELLLGLELG